MAWGRVVRLEAVNKDGVQVDVAGLRIDASCTRSRVFDDNSMDATIINANDDTVARFLQRGTNVALYAGYEDEGEPGLMYQGNIIDSKTVQQGPDRVTTIRSMSLRSLTRPFTATPVCLSFLPNSTAKDVLESIAATLGLVPIGMEMAAEVVFPSGWTFVGPVSNAFKRLGQDLRAKGMGLYVDLAELVVFRHGAPSKYSVVYLTPDTGLLGVQDSTDYMGAARSNLSSLPSKDSLKKDDPPVLTKEDVDDVYRHLEKIFTNMKKTYSVRTLVVPKVRPNSLVRIDYPVGSVSGLFVVDRMNVSVGNGPDSSFFMNLDLVEA